MNKPIIVSLFLLVLLWPLSASIEIRSRHITIADGLANNTVRHLIQDSKGFIWMGTLNGLNRYDGNTFLSYYPSHDQQLSLADRKIYNLQEDRNGFLWICFSSEQYSCFDLKRSAFVDFTGCGESEQKYGKNLLASNGDMWLWHDANGARRVINTGNGFRSVTYKKETSLLPDNTVTFITEDPLTATIWIGTNKGLLKVTDKNEAVVDTEHNFHHMMLHGSSLYFCTIDGKILQYDASSSRLVRVASLPAQERIFGSFVFKESWLIYTQAGVYCYDFTTGRLKQDPDFWGENIPSGHPLEDNKGNYWVYNHTGKIWYINIHTGEKKKFTLIPEEKMGYIDYERYQIVHDSRNIIWISTYGNGLFAYDISKDELSHFKAGIDGLSHINSDYLLGVMEDRSGEIWVSAEYSGVSHISVINEGSYRHFPEDPKLLDRSNTIRMISGINENEIWIGTRKGGLYVYDAQLRLVSRKDMQANIYAVEKDSEGKIWMGSRGDGLCIDGVWYRNSSADPNSISNNNVFCMFKDSHDRMWIGTFGGGLSLAVKEDGKYIFHCFLNRTYGQRLIRSICEDKNGMIWVGTSEGVYIFHPESITRDPDQYYHYSYAGGQLNSDEIKYLFSDSQGNVWVSAAGAGVSVCKDLTDYSFLTFEHYDTKNGLCNDVVHSMAEDAQGNLWLATEYGISKLILPAMVFENYYFSSYLQGNVYTESAVFRRDDGSILFGTSHGFISFHPADINKQSFTSPVVFTNLNINGMNVLPGDKDSPLTHSMAFTDAIRLKHNQNSIQVDFSSFNYVDDKMTKYSYRLLNYDKDWSVPSALNFAAYKMLPPGKYELQVKSENSLGIWNETLSQLYITITPPFYLTVWAFLLYALFAGLALFFAIRISRNFNRLNNKIEIEKQLTEYKLVFFTNISHEFRTPLTLIQGALDRINRSHIPLKEISYPMQIMEKSTRRMIRLIDQLLEFRKMQNNKLALSLEKTDVIAMLYEIFLSFGDMAESKNMDFQFLPSSTSLKMFVDKGKLDKIAYNLLSNAFKYTPPGGKICLLVNEDVKENRLELQVTDTGVGIPKEKRDELFKRFMQSNFSGDSVGVGLHLTLELVQVHKGEITYDENPGGGSVFTVRLPMEPTVYEEKDFLSTDNALMQQQGKESFVSDSISESASTESYIKPNPLNKQKILIIEDDVDVRQYLKEELSPYFHIEVADNGAAGFQLAQECDPALIVCDVLMPEMNGYEVTRKLKGEFQTSHIPVILLTALSLPENHLEGIESGADAYLSKPFSIRLLLARIVKLMEQREKLKEKFSEEPGIVRSAVYASVRDKEFVDELHEILVKNLGNSRFSVDEFASQMNVGRTVFYKKVKGLTGYSPNEYLRVMRMKKAAELLATGKLTVSEISYMVGIEDPFYFSKCFKAQFGMAPSVYLKNKDTN
ncbi:response regulator [Parabacteroides sp. OttesenSCG-928-J18]|nr:response regulator [Parabacteroides sp. OttesenSCG-928-J18]